MCMHRNVLKHKAWAINLRNFNYHSLSQARLQIEKKMDAREVSNELGAIYFQRYLSSNFASCQWEGH